MTLHPQSWLPAAQELGEGQRRRVDHDCGAGRTMIVKHGPNGWDAYCWRCSDKGFVPHPQPSLAERVARLTAERTADSAAEADPRPPLPANFDPQTWPLEARVWLYKAGISNDRIKDVGFYHCPRLQRVVLPVFNASGELAYWQARGFSPERPKYLNPPIDKPIAKYGSGPTLVITEDILSAVRCGEVTEAWSLLGTAIPDDIATDIARLDKPVAIWLDPDAAGRKGRRRVFNSLRLLGCNVRIISTPKDPKFYSKEEICSTLFA